MVHVHQCLVVDVPRRFSVHQLERNTPPEALPPNAHRQMVAVKEDGVWTLHLVSTEDADVVDERHLLIGAEPYEVDDVGHDEGALVAAGSHRSTGVVYRVVDVKVYVDVLKYNAVVIEHDTEVHAGDNERHRDHQPPTSGHGAAVTLRHAWTHKATQMQRRHAPTHALTHMRSPTHTKRNLSNFSSGMRETTIESDGRLR